MSIKNKVQLIGHAGQDSEIVDLESGKKVARVSIAVNEDYKNANGEKQTRTEWFNLVAWNSVATIFENYVQKGKKIAIEGKLTSRSYEDKGGTKRYVTEVLVNEVLLLSNKESE